MKMMPSCFALKRFAVHVVHVDALFALLLNDYAARFLDGELPALRLFRQKIAKHLADVQVDARGEHRVVLAALLLNLNLNQLLFESARAEFGKHALAFGIALCLLFLAGFRLAGLGLSRAEQNLERILLLLFALLCTRQQQINQRLLRCGFRNQAHIFHPAVHADPDCRIHKIAHHALDIAPDITDFRILRGFHLDKGSVHKLCKPSGDLGFTHAGWANHDDILGRNLLAQLVGKATSAIAVA